ncbi:alpha/beta fold hydrolase [Streptomyces mirabilis]|uniref:alpha/beta fold hydrolase n=1 Tax=Streptomyces mirabilis TaxID=68239 RepID=UPI003693F652
MTTNRLEGVTEKLIRTSLSLISVRVGGRPDGPAMVCWPSLMMGGTMWQYQHEHFAPTHRVVLIDSPGHGKSDALRKIMISRTAPTRSSRSSTRHRQGNSWGGMLAGVFPAYYPQRTTAAISPWPGPRAASSSAARTSTAA